MYIYNIYIIITKDGLLKLQQSAQLKGSIATMAQEMTMVCDSKFHAYAIIRHTFDY